MAALTSSLPDLPGTAHHYQECQSRLQRVKRSSIKVLQLGIKRTTDKIFCLIQFFCGLFFATLLTVYKLPGGSEWDAINTFPSLISPMASQIRHVQDTPVHFTAAEVKRGR
jgi:hypothetical protein